MSSIGQTIQHSHFGKGVIVHETSETFTIWFKSLQNTKNVSKDFEGITGLDSNAEDQSEYNDRLSISDIELALENVLNRSLHEFQLVPLANKWQNGNLILQPEDKSLQEKVFPIETFFHKIVMVRDRLRLIEQKINAHKGLTDEDKIDLQQYITGVYGSLTSFNILFKEQHHNFKGSGK